MHIFTFPISFLDIATLTPIIVLVGIIFYLSNKEMKKSLEKSQAAQDLLSKDHEELRAKLSESEQALKDARLARLNELARAAEFGRLSQGLFHDLITPLTSIILHTEKLKETELPSQNIEKAMEASRRMAAYIKDIRSTLLKEESERCCIVREELESVIRFFSFIAREKGVTIVVKRADDCAWTGSPTKLRQLFSNLISNALDSYDEIRNEREKKIIISLIKNTANELRISDTGCGIPREHLQKIFEPFFTTKNNEKGTGIGLTTVKSIVEKNLRGSIRVESHSGKGTLICISYPLETPSGI